MANERDASEVSPQEVPYNSKTKRHGLKMRQNLLKEPILHDPTGPDRIGRKKRRDGVVDWDKVKVFAKPELRMNLRLSNLLPGRHLQGQSERMSYLEAAVRSGLAEMVSHNEASREAGLMVPFDRRRKHIPKIDLAQLIREGMENTLRQLEALPPAPPPVPPTPKRKYVRKKH